MDTKTTVTHKFTHRIAKIITEVSAITGIDEVHAEAIEELLKAELNEYCRMLDSYYEEEGFHNVIFRARSIAYDDGRVDGYADGYEEGYAEGYDVGFEDGYAV